mmetsp:Transcript_26416/g.47642  ORF Transcript_26416/g.47642 Transcript_26416/m.47642 type:complete len:268 (-) Transcript_26416:102-905(-)
MGCSASAGNQEAAQQEVKEQVETLPSTWATKATEANRSPKSGDPQDGRSPSAAGESTTASPSGAGAQKHKAAEPLLMSDADGDSVDVEVIYEGKTSQNGEAANGQEAPEYAEPEPARAISSKVAEEPKPVLSKQQQEEAAKMAEQRKRFDEKRYQKETGGYQSGGAGELSPSFAPAQGDLQTVSTHDSYQRPVPAFKETVPAHEAVVGVNASATPRKVNDILDFEALPGGIMDEPRQVVLPASRNNHKVFDDDDEMLMKEILNDVGI